RGRLIPQIVKPMKRAERYTVELGRVTIHGSSFTRHRMHDVDVGCNFGGTTKMHFIAANFEPTVLARWHTCPTPARPEGHFRLTSGSKGLVQSKDSPPWSVDAD